MSMIFHNMSIINRILSAQIIGPWWVKLGLELG